MSGKQWLIVIGLGIADLCVLCLLAIAVIVGRPGDLTPAGVVEVTNTPQGGAPPTWTPEPTAPPSTPVPTPVPPTSTPRSLDPNEAALMGQVGEAVAAMRDLQVTSPISQHVLTEYQLRRWMGSTYGGEEAEEQARALVLSLATFDLIDPGQDMMSLLQDVFAEGIAGFYDAESGTIYMIDNGSVDKVEDRVLFAHEFTHALQDQNFDLLALGIYATDHSLPVADRSQAIRALVEGDAEVVQEMYIANVLSQEEIVVLRQAAMRGSSSPLDDAPRVIREFFLFPYTYGESFVATLYEEGGWERVNGAYFVLPASTEHILHPQRYLEGDQPQPVVIPSLEDVLGDGWQLLYDDTVGEFFLRTYLESRVEPPVAAVAAEGWGGDQCVVYHNDATGESVMLLHVVWDTLEDADEFLAAYFNWAEARFGHGADSNQEGVACWDGEDVLCVAWEGQATTIVRGPGRGVVAPVLGRAP